MASSLLFPFLLLVVVGIQLKCQKPNLWKLNVTVASYLKDASLLLVVMCVFLWSKITFFRSFF